MKRPLNKEILKLAVPNILSNISVPLLSSIDTILMGGLSMVYIGAIGLGSMLFNFLYWNFGFLRMGTTGMTAQAFGGENHREIFHVFVRSIIVGLTIGIMLWLLSTPILKLGVSWLQIEETHLLYLKNYFNIRILAAPASLTLYALMGWSFGLQNAIIPLVVTIFINVVNILLSYYLVNKYGMAEKGVAWGTVVAQYLGVVLGFILIVNRYSIYFKKKSLKGIFELNKFLDFLKVNSNIFIRTLFLTFAFGFVYSQSSSFGPEILAVNVILLQFVNWMSYGVDGFAFASESLVGKYFGAKDRYNLMKSIKVTFLWGMGFAVLYSLVYGLLGFFLVGFFTDDASLKLAIEEYWIWMIILPVLGTPSYLMDGIYIGLTAAKSMRNSMALAFIVFISTFFLTYNTLDNHGLWLALVLFLVARALFQYILFYKSKKVDGLPQLQ